MELSETLRAAATPELYRRNAFRAAGRPVDAEPVEGIIDTFFWFWPTSDDADAAVAAGNLDRAEAIWERTGTDVAQHNLAVLNHMLALDDEHEGKPLPRSGAPRRWRQAYQYWLAVWQSDRFWEQFAGRASRLGHPGPETAATFRDHLPLMLASISAAVAIRCGERGLPAEAAMVFWRLTSYSGFPAGTREAAADRAIKPIAARIRESIQVADRAEEESPGQAAAAARRLYESAAPLLTLLAASGAPNSDGLHDAVAAAMMRCALVYHRESNDREATLGVLRLARSVVHSADILREIDKQLQEAGRTEYLSGGMKVTVQTLSEEEARPYIEMMRRAGRPEES